MAKDYSEKNKRIAKNAVFLYFRMFVSMAISFFTSRVVLQALGVEDFGVFNVVGSVIVMVGTLTGALGAATGRYLTYGIGLKDLKRAQVIFSTAFYIHLTLSILFVLVAETLGLWVVNTQLNIPEGRMFAANIVYQVSIFSAALGMTQAPYGACMSAHEHFGIVAYFSIADSVIKLLIAYATLYSSFDHLIFYATLYIMRSVMFRIIYRVYCIRKFQEAHLIRVHDWTLVRGMLSFSGLSAFSSIAGVTYGQGITWLVNRFFGVAVNAASGVAMQVQGILYSFIQNVTSAFRPQIIKEYACKDYDRVQQLVLTGTKISSGMILLPTIPVVINIDYLMSLWLEEVPPMAPVICQIYLIKNVFNCLNPLPSNGVTASGKIKDVSLLSALMYLITLGIVYVAIKLTHSVVATFLCELILPAATGFLYAYYLRKYMPAFSIRKYYFGTVAPLYISAFLSIFATITLCRGIEGKLSYFIVTSVVSLVLTAALVYGLVFDKNSRRVVNEYVTKKLKKHRTT